jgi:hypothetical protein
MLPAIVVIIPPGEIFRIAGIIQKVQIARAVHCHCQRRAQFSADGRASIAGIAQVPVPAMVVMIPFGETFGLVELKSSAI